MILKLFIEYGVDSQYDVPKSVKYLFLIGLVPIMEATIDWYGNDWVSCHDLAVYPSFCGLGLGHVLIKFAKSLGVNHLSVAPENSWAISLYQKHGFRLTGSKDGEYLRMVLTGK